MNDSRKDDARFLQVPLAVRPYLHGFLKHLPNLLFLPYLHLRRPLLPFLVLFRFLLSLLVLRLRVLFLRLLRFLERFPEFLLLPDERLSDVLLFPEEHFLNKLTICLFL